MTIMAIEELSVSDKNVNNLLFSRYVLVNHRRRGQRHGQLKKEKGIAGNKAERTTNYDSSPNLGRLLTYVPPNNGASKCHPLVKNFKDNEDSSAQLQLSANHMT
nr:hypothetical protein BgiMline_007966 [Biomphalaria glabrata]